jgi:hypothetical protein
VLQVLKDDLVLLEGSPKDVNSQYRVHTTRTNLIAPGMILEFVGRVDPHLVVHDDGVHAREFTKPPIDDNTPDATNKPKMPPFGTAPCAPAVLARHSPLSLLGLSVWDVLLSIVRMFSCTDLATYAKALETVLSDKYRALFLPF